MSNNFLRRDSCEHAFNREIANDTAKTTCCSIDPFGMFHNRNWLSVISSEESVIQWNFSFNCCRLSLPNFRNGDDIFTRSVREKALIFFNARNFEFGEDIIARLTHIDRSWIGLFFWNDRLIYIRVAVTFERLHAMTSPPSFYYRYSLRYRRDLSKNQTIYAVYNV